jgi:DNA-directed RNA polymerase specialized sigma24 family protein
MTDPNQDSTISLTLPVMASPPLSTRPSEIEEEVIFLFDQLYDRLSGYLLSFGLTVHDAEDIVQETFLALFRHLQLGRSRRSLGGRIFRVGHNLTLKRRKANQASRSNVAMTPLRRCTQTLAPARGRADSVEPAAEYRHVNLRNEAQLSRLAHSNHRIPDFV